MDFNCCSLCNRLPLNISQVQVKAKARRPEVPFTVNNVFTTKEMGYSNVFLYKNIVVNVI